MKTNKIVAVIAALLFSISVTAVEKPKMNVQPINANQVLISYESEHASRVEISIYDENENIVYYKRTQKPIQTFNKIFDVKHLENGHYTMQIELNGLQLERKIEITEKKIFVRDSENAMTPLFVQKDERLLLSHLNPENKGYRLTIYNDSGLVYQKKLTKQSPLHAGFNISALKPGSYTVVLDSGNDNYEYQFDR